MNTPHHFQGDLSDAAGRVVAPAGFMPAGQFGPFGGPLGPSRSIYLTRGNAVSLSEQQRDLMTRMQRANSFEEFQRLQAQHDAVQQQQQQQGRDIQRAEGMWDAQQLAFQLGKTVNELARGITSGQTGFPVRENLEAESKILIPVETPIRNKLPREPGSGLSSLWRQTSSLGGGWGSATDQPGGGAATQFFFAEAGAPGQFTSVYVPKASPYKLAGVFGAVTGFAMAAGEVCARSKSRCIGETLQ
jgi:hypothetical protein